MAQSMRSININQYKYIVIDEITGNNRGETRRFVVKNLKKAGYKVINLKSPLRTHQYSPFDLQDNPKLAVYLSAEVNKTGCFYVKTNLYTTNNTLLSTKNGSSCGLLSTAVKASISNLTSYKYQYTPKKVIVENKPNLNLPSSLDIASIREFLDLKKDISKNEGLYSFYSKDPSVTSQYKFLIVKKDYTYYGILVEGNCVGCQNWTVGDIKFRMVEGAIDDMYEINWKNPQHGQREEKLILSSKINGKLLETTSFHLMKLYPKSKNNISKNGEWSGSGSGIIISKTGYIVTNHHVIKNAEDIEIEVKRNDTIQKFQANIVQVDKVNDLAVLKISDMKLGDMAEPPFNFKNRISEVGTKVYAYGYPMALSAMGREVKITDGIISSKTGFDGDATTYQITAAVQPGSSGGPLFDEHANLIGIVSSGLSKNSTDNVGYSIKTGYVLNLLDIIPNSIELPSNKKLKLLTLTEQIKEISKFVVLIKVN